MDRGVRRKRIVVRNSDASVERSLVDHAVEKHHLAIHGVERAYAEIAAALKLAHRQLAVVQTRHQGVQRRVLIQFAWRA
jgi:hypothetical protein